MEIKQAVETAVTKAEGILKPFGFEIEADDDEWGLCVTHPKINEAYFIGLNHDNTLDMTELYNLPIAIAQDQAKKGRNQVRKDLTETLKLEE